MTIAVTANNAISPAATTGEASRYGEFSNDGREFVITNPRTPRPWANVIANPRAGLVVSQTGSGFSWIDNSQLAVITRWEQDLTRDSSGKFLYVRDAESSELWSLSPAPVWASGATHTCRHGLGYSIFESRCAEIRGAWTLFVDATQPIEYWRVQLRNESQRTRRLDLCALLEWNCGVAPSPRREFHKLFLETAFDSQRGAILAWNHMWDVPIGRYGHWNADFPYVTALAGTEPVLRAQADKTAFLGRYGDYRDPAALREEWWKPRFGRHDDAIAALQSQIELRPGQTREIGFALVTGTHRAQVEATLERVFGGADALQRMDAALQTVRAQWETLLGTQRMQTPDASLNYLVNDWVRYQAISARLWGRCGYYQQSGAFGFRDQLQDSQVWLPIEPQRCRAQLNLHAAHQFKDGSVVHWWHPLTEQGHVTRMTDDLLWLAYVTANYIRETGDLSVLADPCSFLDDPTPAALAEHVRRAFARVFARSSPRGLPYIGAGDWNDGLSAVGLQERGESVWLGHFLAGLLADWAEIYRRVAAATSDALRRSVRLQRDGSLCELTASEWSQLAAEFSDRRTALVEAINAHAWDGEWYWRATRDDGQKLGSRENSAGRIFLNAQTWAILNDVAPSERARACWQAVKAHLLREVGPLLLTPAYQQPDERIGYITRYAPGLRENGGVYTHAATWAIAAACKMRDAETVAKLLKAINPAQKDPERYWAEPFVLPGNVDGPESPYFGRAGWTWYTGSAQWLARVVTEHVLGVRPEWDGLRIDPCLPPGWNEARLTRLWRGGRYSIRIERTPGNTGSGGTSGIAGAAARAAIRITQNGHELADTLLAPPKTAGQEIEVHVQIGVA